jgi:general secretion pathway protein L
MLIIGLPHDPATETYDHVLSEEGARPVDQGAGLPHAFSGHKQRVALVPHTRLSWHRVRLPAVARGQQRAAIEGLLEDQWLQTPQHLHLSLHPIADAPDDAPNSWVCVCDAQWLRQVLQPLIKAGCMPQRLIPEFAPTETNAPEVVHVIGPADQTAVVWLRPQGVLAAPWPQPWPLLAATPLQVWAEPAVFERAQAALTDEPDTRVQTLTRAQRWAAAATSRFDLAQGEWSQTPAQKIWRATLAMATGLLRQPQWKPARWAVGLILAGQALGVLTWSWLNDQDIQARKRELQDMLTQSFPDTTTVVDAPLQMQQALNRLRLQVGAPGPNQAEDMLKQLTQGLNPLPEITRIRFDGQALTVQGIRSDTLSPTHKQALSGMGYSLQDTADGVRMRWEGKP